jgi:CDP-4-dehydro-6-deoxyglucose reductase
MQHRLGDADETAQGFRPIKIADDLHDALRLQVLVAFAHQAIDPVAPQQPRQRAADNIAAADHNKISHPDDYRMPFQITIQPSGHVCQADDDDTILQAALDAGLLLPYGCRNGACGACKGKVVSGTIDHDGAQPTALSDEDRRRGLALFCCARPQSDIVIECREVAKADDIRVRTMPCRVQAMRRLAPDVMLLELKLPTSERLQFLPGQYIEFLLPQGHRRAFSLANAPDQDGLLQLHVRRIPGGVFTEQVFTTMKERDILRFEGPHGGFYLRDAAAELPRPMILLAGGTGFAPIKAIVEHMIAHGIVRPMTLYWGARDRAGLYLNDLPQRWAVQHPHIRYTPVLSEPAPGDAWAGRSGLVHRAVLEDVADLSGHDVYACGAPAMIDAARSDFTARGLPLERFFADVFSYAAKQEAMA